MQSRLKSLPWYQSTRLVPAARTALLVCIALAAGLAFSHWSVLAITTAICGLIILAALGLWITRMSSGKPMTQAFTIEAIYLCALVGGFMVYQYQVAGGSGTLSGIDRFHNFIRQLIPDPVGPIPLGIPFLGALGAVIRGITWSYSDGPGDGSMGSGTTRDPSHIQLRWHLARPLVGAVFGAFTYLFFLSLLDPTGKSSTSAGGKFGTYVLAFAVGYSDGTFARLVERVVNVLLGPGDADGTPAPQTPQASTGTDTAFRVSSVSPADGASDVSTGSVISATFNRGVSEDSLTAQTFQLFKGVTQVPATIHRDSAANTVVLQPDVPLEPSRQYRAVVVAGTSGVRDADSNALAAGKEWHFATGTE